MDDIREFLCWLFRSPLHYDHRYSSPVTYSDLDHRLRQYEHYPWMRDFPEPLRRLRCKD